MTAIALAAAIVASDPAREIEVAVADLRTNVAPADWPVTRYLSLYAIERGEWTRTAAAVSLVLNSVSRARSIVHPRPVPGTNGRMLRICWRAYDLPLEGWEALVSGDPYWHLRTQVVDPRTRRVREVITDGGWVGLAQAAELRAMTASAGAVLRADYFLVKATTTLDGGLYYQLARIPATEDAFYESLGVDLGVVRRLGAMAGANLIRSRVTHKVRRLARYQGPLGGAWRTFDVATSSPERDAIRHPFGFQYDAGEHIAVKANGLHLFALYDTDGARQDSVPDAIAKDDTDTSDGRLAPMLSCVRCHVEDGLRPFANDQHRLMEDVVVLTERADEAERLIVFYDQRELDKQARRDRDDYAEAVGEATGGLSTAEVAAALAEACRRYRHELVSCEQAARELGVGESDFTRRTRGSTDPLLLALGKQMSIQRQQWEASFAEAALLVKGGEP